MRGCPATNVDQMTTSSRLTISSASAALIPYSTMPLLMPGNAGQAARSVTGGGLRSGGRYAHGGSSLVGRGLGSIWSLRGPPRGAP